MRFTGFCGPTYSHQSPNVDSQRCVNFYPEILANEDPLAKTHIALIGTPGSKVFCTPTSEAKIAISSTEVSRIGDKLSQIKTLSIVGGGAGLDSQSDAVPTGVTQSGVGVEWLGSDKWSDPLSLQKVPGTTTPEDTATGWEKVDGAWRTHPAAPITQTDYLIQTHCGFSVPSNAVIVGVKVNYGLWSQSASSAKVNGVKLVYDDAQLGDEKDPDATVPQNNYAQRSQGGSSDTWGAELTPAIVNSTSFGFGVKASFDSIRLFGGYFQVIVYYIVPDADGLNYIQTSDDKPVGILMAGAETSRYLDCKKLGFTIPTGSTIHGYKVSMRRKAVRGTVRDAVVMLLNVGGYGDNKAGLYTDHNDTTDEVIAHGDDWTVTAAYQRSEYGASSDDWDTDFTPEIVNSDDFGVRVMVYNSAGTSADALALIDYLKVTVFYSPLIPEKLVVETSSDHEFVAGDKLKFYDVTALSEINDPAFVKDGDTVTTTPWEPEVLEAIDATHFSVHLWPASLYGPSVDTGSVCNIVDPYVRVVCESNHHLGSGTEITFSDMSLSTWLNGFSKPILSVEDPKTLKVATDHADYATTAETGSISLGSVTGLPISRELAALNGRAFSVNGSTLYELKADGTYEVIGSGLANDNGAASIAFSSTEMLVATGGDMYVLTLATNAFDGVPNYSGGGAIPAIASVHYLNGYFIAVLKDSQDIIVSDSLDAKSWDANLKTRISVFPDNIVSAVVDHQNLLLKCSSKSCAYYFSGSEALIDLVPGSVIDQGSAAPRCHSRLDNSEFWIGKDDKGHAIAWRAQGYVPARISTLAVEYAWSQYATIADAVSYAYQNQGHSFWVIYFPTANATWVYDAMTQMWHERQFGSGDTATAHRSQCHCFCFGKHLVGDWATGNIYEMSSTYLDDFGTPIESFRRTPHVSNELKWSRHSKLQLDLDTGVGTIDRLGFGDVGYGAGSFGEYAYGVYPYGQGPLALEIFPKIYMRYSNDGGRTWSAEQERNLGAPGDFKHRVIWRNLGRSRDRVYEIRISDAIPKRIVDAYLEVN